MTPVAVREGKPTEPKASDTQVAALRRALNAVVGVQVSATDGARSARSLGQDRSGSGVIIDADGLILTIGYLLLEADTIEVTTHEGRTFPARQVAYDQATGFGLIQALARLDLPALPIGQSSAVSVGERVVVGGAGGRHKSVAARIVAKQEFAGYWEYVLDEAIFTSPAHPNWGGTAVIGPAGELVGIGSLQLEQGREKDDDGHLNMIVPIDLLKPILDDLRKFGRVNKPARPWLGLYSTEIDNRVVVIGISANGPAARAELKTGDVILAVDGDKVTSQTAFYKKMWGLGAAGVDVPLTVHHQGSAHHEGVTFDVTVTSTDRFKLLKAPKLH